MRTITLRHPESPDVTVCRDGYCTGGPVHADCDHDIASRLQDHRCVCTHCGQSRTHMGGCSCIAPNELLAEVDGETVTWAYDA